jgi:capsular polysaccharide biosynthesis protein
VPVETLRASESPPIGVLTAVRRHWFVAILPVIVFVGAAVALANERPPRYTATADLSVGRIFVNNPAGVSGVIEATQSLASVYSRAISSSAVRDATARAIDERVLRADDDVTATPVPESPLIRITAESSSEGRAIALATAASDALAAYVRRQGRSNKDAAILADYQKAVKSYRQRIEERRRVQRRYDADPTSANEAARDRASVAVSVALLRREAVRANYLNLVQGTAAAASIETFTRATSATSDRLRMQQILVFLGVVAGVGAGTALALLRAYRKSRPRVRG